MIYDLEAERTDVEPASRLCRVGRGLGDEGQPCETNPICPPTPGGGGREAIMRNKAKLGWAAVSGEGALGELVVQNEANFDRTRYPTIPLFHYSSIPTRRRSCETKPIPGGAGWTGPQRHPTKGKMCKTKPNLGRMGYLGDSASGGPILQNEPNFRRRRARRGHRDVGRRELCETKPICGGTMGTCSSNLTI